MQERILGLQHRSVKVLLLSCLCGFFVVVVVVFFFPRFFFPDQISCRYYVLRQIRLWSFAASVVN